MTPGLETTASPAQATRLDRQALVTALEGAAHGVAGGAVADWIFAPAGMPSCGLDPEPGASSPVRYAGAPETLHRLLCGIEPELLAVLTGRIVATGPLTKLLSTLRALPDVGARYSEIVGEAGFEHRPIMAMRKLRTVDLDGRRGYPSELSDSPTDQALLVALVIGGLPTACRAVQTAGLFNALRGDPVGLDRLALLFGEFADLVAGTSNRAAPQQGLLQY